MVVDQLALWIIMMLVVVIKESQSAVAASIAKPGCPDICGNISIPYPFGIGPDCFAHEGFSITCNNSFTPPRSLLMDLQIQIQRISLKRGTIGGVSPIITPNCSDRVITVFHDVLQWGTKNCTSFFVDGIGREATSLSGSLCGSNAFCDGGDNHLCYCDRGYDGNPYLSDGCQGLTMAPGRRLTRSMLPAVVDDQSRCCRGETSDLSSPRDAPIHSHSPGETSVQSEPSTPHTPSSVGSNVSGRGPTRGKGLDKLIRAAGHKLKVDIDPVLGRPTDEVQSAKLSSEIGVLTRDSIAKKYNKWSEVPKTDEEELFTRLNMRIDVNTSAPHAKRTCTELAMARMRSSNYELHKVFKKYSSVDEARAHCPVGLSQADWDKKCEYFSSESFKKRSEINKKNRAQQTVTHCMGSRSFVVGKAKKEKEYGRPLGRCEWWKCSRHTDANGWCCDQARVIHEEMEERLNQPISEGETRPTEDEVADCVLGKKPGYVNGLGHGPRPTPCSSQTVSSEPDQEVISLRGIVESQQAIISRMAAEQAEMAASQATMAASQEQMKQFIEQLMKQNPQPSPAPST